MDVRGSRGKREVDREGSLRAEGDQCVLCLLHHRAVPLETSRNHMHQKPRAYRPALYDEDVQCKRATHTKNVF